MYKTVSYTIFSYPYIDDLKYIKQKIFNLTVCEVGFWGKDCVMGCSCASPTTVCDPENGCAACASGYTGMDQWKTGLGCFVWKSF